MFDLIVLYEWKPGVTPERIEHHFRLIRTLVGKVPGLVALRIGPRTLGFGPTSEGWTHGCVMTFEKQADLARLTAIGFASNA